jgi:hypothetical protein
MYLFNKIKKFFTIKEFDKCSNILSWRFKKKPESSQSNVISINNDLPIQFVMNDLTTLDLIKEIKPPVYLGNTQFTVKNYKGGGFDRASEEGQAANCFVVLANTLNFLNSKTEKPLPNKWAGTFNLQIYPRAGNDLNAYYNRKSLSFFSFTHEKIGGTIHTCDSAEIIAHELGHAILDTYRPETWNAALIEVHAFHEAFADFIAITHSMLYDEIITKALLESNNDLKNPNVISKIAEQFGLAIYRLSGRGNGMLNDCLRSAINSFVYIDPSNLPKNAPENELSFSPHSFGRVFLGALYDIFIMIFEENLKEGFDHLTAVKKSRDTISSYVLKSIQNAPINAKFYQSMATTILWSDVVINKRKYHDKIRKIFIRRNLIPLVSKMMLNAPICPENDFIIKKMDFINVKLKDVVIKSQYFNPLYNVLVEIPNEKVFLYDENKNFYDSISISEEDSIKNACDVIDYLNEESKVSEDESTPFEVVNGKLVRNYI